MKVKVSVIVPVYNVEAYVENCINSILSQEYKNYELILLNDGSTDGSLDILRKYEKIPFVTIINKDNTGQSDTRLQGLRMAKGEFVYFIDSDDTIEQYTLGRLVKAIESIDADVAFGRYRLVDEDGKVLREQKRYNIAVLTGTEAILKDAICVSNFKASLCLKLIRKSVLMSSYVDEVRGIHLNEDIFLSVMIASNSKRVVFINDIIYNVLQRSGSITRNIKPELMSVNDIIFKYIKNRLVEQGFWQQMKSDFYNGYVKTILYALALVGVKCESFAVYKQYYSLIDADSIYYSQDLRDNLSCITNLYRFLLAINRCPRLFFLIIKGAKPVLRY